MNSTHRLFSSLSKTMASPRSIQKVFLAREQSEGAGARIRRSIGTAQMPEISPFLMLDHFKSTSLAGFPDHPHRGQGELPFPTKPLNIASMNLVRRIYAHVLISSRNNYLPNQRLPLSRRLPRKQWHHPYWRSTIHDCRTRDNAF